MSTSAISSSRNVVMQTSTYLFTWFLSDGQVVVSALSRCGKVHTVPSPPIGSCATKLCSWPTQRSCDNGLASPPSTCLAGYVLPSLDLVERVEAYDGGYLFSKRENRDTQEYPRWG